MEQPHVQGVPSEAPVRSHEEREVSLRTLAWAVGSLTVLTIVTMLAIGWLFGLLLRSERQAESPVPQLSLDRPPPPAPRLQVNPYGDLQQMRRSEQDLLSTYGWIDRSAGVVHVPIDRAMELAAQGHRASIQDGPATRPATQPATMRERKP